MMEVKDAPVALATVPKPRFDLASSRAVILCLGLMMVGVGVASLEGAGLTWDGSYTFLKVIDQPYPYVVHSRWLEALLQFPTIGLSQLTNRYEILQTVFSLSYGLIPLLALFLSWWVVRKEAPGLFLWAAFGIGLITLPGQIGFISDAAITMQLGWPLLLIVLTDFKKAHFPLVGLLSLAIFFDHPLAIGLFVLAAVLSFANGVTQPGQRQYLWLWAGGFIALAALDILKFAVFHTVYEDDQLSVNALVSEFNNAVAGSPLAGVIFSWVAALLIFMQNFFRRSRQIRVGLGVGAILSLGIAGVIWLEWASDPHQWSMAIDYRLWTPFLSLPIILLATLESLWPRLVRANIASERGSYRTLTVQLIGLVFMIVLVVQATAWANLSNRLEETMAQSPTSCVSQSSLNWLVGTPLNHWSVTAYSLLLSGTPPTKVVLSEAGCASANLNQTIPLADWDSHSTQGGQLNLVPLAQSILAQQQNPPECRFFMTDGWYAREQNGQSWWRWNNGSGKIVIFSNKATSVMLNGTLKSLQQPNQVGIQLNGQTLTTLAVDWSGVQSFKPVTLSLVPGRNEIDFISHNPATTLPGDNRTLAILVGDISLTDSDGTSVCNLQN